MKICLILFAILAAVAGISAVDYCSMDCEVNGTTIKHIACNNNNQFAAHCEEGIKMLDMEDYIKQVIHEHNKIRNEVAGGFNSSDGPVCRMATVKWDNDLAENAALNIKRCEFETDLCRGTPTFPSSGQMVSQNLLYRPDTPVAKFLESSLRSFFVHIRDVEKFGDMITDRNTHVGCAVSVAPSEYNGKRYTSYRLTCNHSTNIADRESMFKTCESAGQECKSGRNPDYPYLCSEDEKYDSESNGTSMQ